MHCCPRSSYVAIRKVTKTKNSSTFRPHLLLPPISLFTAGTSSTPRGHGGARQAPTCVSQCLPILQGVKTPSPVPATTPPPPADPCLGQGKWWPRKFWATTTSGPRQSLTAAHARSSTDTLVTAGATSGLETFDTGGVRRHSASGYSSGHLTGKVSSDVVDHSARVINCRSRRGAPDLRCTGRTSQFAFSTLGS